MRRIFIFLIAVPSIWAADNIESALTNAPLSYSDTILVPTPIVPKPIVPQAMPALSPDAYQPITPPKPVSRLPRYLPAPPSINDFASQHIRSATPAPFPTPLPPQSPEDLPVKPSAPVAKPLIPISRPTLFNTPEADAILAAMQIFPSNNVWHSDIRQWARHPNSLNILESIGLGRSLRFNTDMGFVIVPPNAPRATVNIAPYQSESDLGPYPLPENVPIEGWPADYKRSPKLRDLTLDAVQRDVLNLGGDRHAIVVDPNANKLYEFYAMHKTLQGWQAAQASIFDLSSNQLRPDGWSSADAAGLPIFPAVVRYDELVRGEINHALRVTVPHTRRAYVAPATHFASQSNDPNLPRMGERLRLRPNFDLANFSPEVQTILKALKKHGMFVADNGSIFAISITPDERIPAVLGELGRVTVADFEVVSDPTASAVAPSPQ